MKNKTVFDLLNPNDTSYKLQFQAGFYAGVSAMAIAANGKLSEWGVEDDILNRLLDEVKKIHPKEDEMEKKKTTRCYTEEGKRCERNAEFEIMENTRTDPDNFTFSCEDHVGKMLGSTNGFPNCDNWTILMLVE